MNESKQVKEFDPKELIKDLTVKGAAKAILLSSVSLGRKQKAQALMVADDFIGGVTGERLSERICRGFRTEKEIRRHLERGERVIPMDCSSKASVGRTLNSEK